MAKLKAKYQSISRQIESDIEDQLWQERLPGVTVLADHYGVAAGTICKAVKLLSEKGLVTVCGTRGTYISSNPSPRKRHGMIGLVGVPDSDELHQAHQHPRNYVRTKHDGNLVFLGATPDLKDTSPSFFSQLPVDGLVFKNSSITPEVVAELRRVSMPFVSANRTFDLPGVDWVDIDNEQSIRQGLEFLIANGHERIAMTGFALRMPRHQQLMRRVFEDTLCDHDLDSRGLFYFEGDVDDYRARYGSGNAAITYGRRVIEDLLRMSNPPTAILVRTQSRLVDGIIDGARQMGLSLPDDLAIVCGQEQNNDARPTPRPIVARQSLPTWTLLRTAFDMLFHRINQPDLPPQQTLLPTKLHPVESLTTECQTA